MGKPGRRTLYLDSDFLSYDDSGWIIESVKDPLSDVIDDAFEFDAFTPLGKVGAPLIPGVGVKKSAVCGEDLEG